VLGTALSSCDTFRELDSFNFGEGASRGVESDRERALRGDLEGVRTAYSCDMAITKN
jgi:hypothetical protein